jgi:hypothetical protein
VFLDSPKPFQKIVNVDEGGLPVRYQLTPGGFSEMHSLIERQQTPMSVTLALCRLWTLA